MSFFVGVVAAIGYELVFGSSETEWEDIAVHICIGLTAGMVFA